MEDIQEKQEQSTVIFCDNKSAIAMSKNSVEHSKARHIKLKYHFIREAVEDGEIKLKYIKTMTKWRTYSPRHFPKVNFKNSVNYLELENITLRRRLLRVNVMFLCTSVVYKLYSTCILECMLL